VDAAIHKHASILCCIPNEESRVIDEIACLRTNDKRLADGIFSDLGLGISVTGIESSREASHDFEVGIFVRNFDHSLGLYLLMKG
jgi:hypothetical protein